MGSNTEMEMRYKMYICPNCKYKTFEPPAIIKSGRYTCPKCGAGMKVCPVPGQSNNQTNEVNPLERLRRTIK